MESSASEMPAYEKGGPNDPTVTFEKLNRKLVECKGEFSPWGWREYIAEFADKFDAEKRLRALNALPGSGVEPKDGVMKGTPMWQERLDKMFLVEHLKKKIMVSHHHMVLGCELLLKSHAWLVKNPGLADKFSYCIRHIPESEFDRVDILQRKLEMKRKLLKEAREHHEDYLITERRQRDAFLMKTTAHQRISLKEKRFDDILISWSYYTTRHRLTDMRQSYECQTNRVHRLEIDNAALFEDLEESRRQFKEELDWMTADRDKFKKLYERMVAAHEKAKADLEKSKGTAKGMEQMIMILSQEKAMLENKVADLEEEKLKLLKIIEELRELVAKLRLEIKRLCENMRWTELAFLRERKETERLLGVEIEFEEKMNRMSASEVQLRDTVDALKVELDAWPWRFEDVTEELGRERETLRAVENERDAAIEFTRRTQSELADTLEMCSKQIWATKEKCRRDFEYFKNVELAKLRQDFELKTDAILKRNALLEKEAAIGDEVANQLPALNPLDADPSKMCAICQRLIVYEGATEF
eukprot:TRINITY_DN43075_c0_g1_i1.p1 TRINITY_DN43075_c0_g1~~TRINITY_DN43075_c0_g1_i1.p1  ORF type:complete len:530 (+),score=125.26 TRINITY_DN43075_c0_g1_i1:338-1927(+)